MPVRVFKEAEKAEIKEKLLSVGFPMLKEFGMIHMSIPKIAASAGIGTGTFYRFFKSKEDYIYQVIAHQRKIFMSEFITEDVLAGRRKLSKDEVRSFIRLITDPERSVYANLSLGDEAKLFESVSELTPDINHEKQIADGLLMFVENPRTDIDYPLLANLMKVLAITSQARDELHESGYERTIDLLIEAIINQIFA